MSPGMEYQDTLPVCGTTYRCVRPAEGGEASWRRRDVQDGEVLVTCRTDALYAMAKAANCPIALRDAPERCRVGDMLRKEGDDARRMEHMMRFLRETQEARHAVCAAYPEETHRADRSMPRGRCPCWNMAPTGCCPCDEYERTLLTLEVWGKFVG